MQKCSNANISERPKCKTAEMPKWQNVKGIKEVEMSKGQQAKMPKFPNAKIVNCENAKKSTIPKYQHVKIPKCKQYQNVRSLLWRNHFG